MIHLRQFKCFMAALTVALAGCAAKNVPNDFSFKANQNEGIAVISVSHDLAGGRGTHAIFYINGGVLEKNGQLMMSLREAFPGIPGGSDFEDTYGNVFVISLPAGHHAITSWQISNGTGLRIHPRQAPTPLAFDIVAGQVKYLGNLHANLRTGKNLLGITIVGDGSPEVRDEQQRDLTLLAEKYPQLNAQVAIDLLKLGPWVTGTENNRQMDIPYIAPQRSVRP